MLRGIVQAFLRLTQGAGVEKGVAELTVGQRQTFFIADAAVAFQRVREVGDGLIPVRLPRFFHAEVVIQNPERAVIVKRFQQIEGFKVVGAGFLWTAGTDVEVPQIYQCVRDGLLVPFRPLDREHFPVAGLGSFEVPRQGADISEIAE